MSAPDMKSEFAVNQRFSPNWNKGYDFDNPANQAEIAKQDGFDVPGALEAMEKYKPGGGDTIESPWGLNWSINAGDADAHTVKDYLARFNLSFDALLNPTEGDPVSEGKEFCVKGLIVEPGNQLSLQRHRGREEYWMVKEGLLTVIVDGHQVDVPAGQAIFIPKGSVHCMNNRTDAPVHVEELQFGICREADNVRLLDATRDKETGAPKPRATYPITSENEFISAQLFAQLAIEIGRRNGLSNDARFEQIVAVQPKHP